MKTNKTKESTNKTWFIDIDGTIVKHIYDDKIDAAIEKEGDKSHLLETPIKVSVDFLDSIPGNDTVILTTARDSKHAPHTIKMLRHYNIRYDRILFDLRAGPRVIINDMKPIGTAGNSTPMKTAYAINTNRNEGILDDHKRSII
jgi:hypothetical protein